MDTDDKAILTWRVAEENPQISLSDIFLAVQQKMPGKRLCFLDNPSTQTDTTGHSDGLVSFLDRNTLLVADYGDGRYNAMVQTLIDCFPAELFPFLRIIRMPSGDNTPLAGPVNPLPPVQPQIQPILPNQPFFDGGQGMKS